MTGALKRASLTAFLPGVAILLALAISVTAIVTAQLNARTRPQFNFPDDADITNLRAMLYKAPKIPSLDTKEEKRPINEFDVARERIASITHWLRPPLFTEKNFFLGDPIGRIIVETKSRRKFELQLYWIPMGPVAFTVDGANYFFGNEWCGSDGGAGVRRAIMRAYEDADNLIEPKSS